MSMVKKIAAFGAVLLMAAAIAAGVVAYSYLKPAEAATGPIEAIPLAAASVTPTTGSATSAATVATGTGGGSTANAAPPTSGTSTSGNTPPAATPSGGAAATTAAIPTTGGTAGAAPAATTTCTIDQSASQARFVIDEVLNGTAKTVIGSTDQVAGQIAVDPTAPSGAQIGTIQINARTLSTDSEQRNNTIKNQSLKTNANQYITFVPTSVTGLPATATIGQAYTFQAVGQLTVAGQAREATLAVTVTPNADGTLKGSAKTTARYADWGISIPKVPQVASVSDTLALELDFVARAN
jgi:polyisoprenoid-binding protein YceI